MGCAQQSSPTGGPKDTIPPKVIFASPEMLTTNFSGSSIELEFDEYIQVKDLSSQLIVSPPLKKNPEYKIRGKRLILSWNEALRENTTYQFNFGKSVVDLNEGNPATDLIFVFSTGDVIDSLTVRGTLRKAFTNEPVEGAAVMIYQGESDTLPLKAKPDYFALSDANGAFQLNYLPSGNFKIFALLEENPNYNYGGPPELIGFLEERVEAQPIDSNLTETFLPMFMERDTSLFISTTVSKDYGFYEVIFNRPAENPQIQFQDIRTNANFAAIKYLSETRDTLRSWVVIPKEEEKAIDEVRVIVSNDTTFLDTSFWYIETDPKFADKAKLQITSNTTERKLNRSKRLSLTFSNPLASIDTNYLQLLEDSVEIPLGFYDEGPIRKNLFFSPPIREGKAYSMIIGEGAFRDVFGVYNDSVAFNFSLREADYYGNLILNINDSLIGDEPNPVYRFLSESRSLIKSDRVSNEPVKFNQLTPGKYLLEIIYDRNENMEWDTGNYKLGLQPEKKSIYEEEIEIRSNWDLELNWIPAPPY